MPRKQKSTPSPVREIPITPEPEAAQLAGAVPSGTEPATPNVKKYIVHCRCHTEESIAYRVYAASKEDAEFIARLKFRDEVRGMRVLDRVKATEVALE